MTDPKMQNTPSRIRTVQLVLALAFGALSSPVTATDTNKLSWCEGHKWGEDCGETVPVSHFDTIQDTQYDDVNVNSLVDQIRSVEFEAKNWTDGDWPEKDLRGKACVCVEKDLDCVRVFGKMAYLGKAYGDATFLKAGLNPNGCGEATPVINDRRAGYLRLESDPGNCIQSTADPAHNGTTHFWDNCATGDNQQRRVISYNTQSHQLQFASKTDLCLLAPSSLAVAEDSFIYISECDTATAEQREWALRGGQIQLKADSSKCIMTSEISAGSDIVLGACSAGAKTNWQLTWTQDH